MKKLIIFDCDGVLVDSEILAHQVDVDTLSSLGYPVTIKESVKRFTGINDKDFRRIIFEESGITIPDQFFEQQRKKLLEVFAEKLNPLMNVVLSVLQERKIETCVASSSPRNRVVKSLDLTNQLAFFSDDTIFVSEQVIKGKPAPDLFLFAADQMGFRPENCIVVEDSIPGIKAAIAANMTVVGFLGGSHAQYDWYENNVHAYAIPVANNDQELLEILHKLMSYS